ncbi:MAG: hypothetical protein ACTS73_02400 [Arsenophonus sp. NEOnobi-MAG3]
MLKALFSTGYIIQSSVTVIYHSKIYRLVIGDVKIKVANVIGSQRK